MPKAKSDGGPAFPQSTLVPKSKINEYMINVGFNGLSIRDYFAAKAMQSLIDKRHPIIMDWSYVIPKSAYNLADAMLKAREESDA